jgi:ureidoglycolate hydrolase
MAATITNVKVEYLSPSVFGSSLGQIIHTPKEGEREPTLQSESFKFYGGIALMNINEVFELGICTFNQRNLETAQLEQHALTQELLFAIDGDFIMPVAPIIQKKGDSWPDLDKLVAIRVRMGEGVVFNDGIWHWAPFPLKERSSVIVGFEKDTANKDLVIRDLDSMIVMQQ